MPEADKAAEDGSHILRMETLIGGVLRYGVLLCGAIMAVGLLRGIFGGAGNLPAQLRVVLAGGVLPAYHPPSLRGFPSAEACLALGLLLLIALPIVRVALTVVVFLLERSWVFFAITAFVLSVLLASVFLGRLI